MERIDSSAIRKAFDLAARLENPINLSIGQPHYPMPEIIAEAIAKAMRDGKTAYTPTQGIPQLRERLAARMSAESGRPCPAERIFVSSGVSSLIQLLFMTMIDPGDRVLLIDPYFLMYRSLGEFFNARIETIPESFSEADIAGVDPAGLKMILYASPSNPSGAILSRKQIELLAGLADRSGALLVSDEIYESFDYDGAFVPTSSVYDKAVVLKGFSKSYSMTGLRLAYATGPDSIIRALTVLQQYTVVCAPAPVQWAGITALDVDMSSYIDSYRKNRDFCLQALSGRVPFSRPAGAFYIFPEVPGGDQAFTDRAVADKKLILVPGSIFSASRKNVRISFATTPENLKRGMDAFLELL